MRNHTEPGEFSTARRRVADNSVWWRLAEWREKFWPLLWLLASLLIAIGFDFKLPSQKFHELQAQLDVVKTEVQEGQKDRQTIAYKVDMLLRVKCIENSSPGRTTIDLRLAGVDCVKLLSQ